MQMGIVTSYCKLPCYNRVDQKSWLFIYRTYIANCLLVLNVAAIYTVKYNWHQYFCLHILDSGNSPWNSFDTNIILIVGCKHYWSYISHWWHMPNTLCTLHYHSYFPPPSLVFRLFPPWFNRWNALAGAAIFWKWVVVMHLEWRCLV